MAFGDYVIVEGPVWERRTVWATARVEGLADTITYRLRVVAGPDVFPGFREMVEGDLHVGFYWEIRWRLGRTHPRLMGYIFGGEVTVAPRNWGQETVKSAVGSF